MATSDVARSGEKALHISALTPMNLLRTAGENVFLEVASFTALSLKAYSATIICLYQEHPSTDYLDARCPCSAHPQPHAA